MSLRLVTNKSLDPTQNAKLATSVITLGTVDANSVSASAYSPELNLIVAVLRAGNNRIAVSNDGTSWTQISTATLTTANLWSIDWSPELRMFVVVGANIILYSYDGFKWFAKTPPGNLSYRHIKWIKEKGFFLASSENTTTANKFIKSVDGINWTGHSVPAGVTIVSFAYSPSLDLFVSANLNTNTIFYSANGETWLSRTITATAQSFYGICWSEELKLFVLVSISFLANNIFTSPDGITWTQRSKSNSAPLGDVCYSPELRLFIAVILSTQNGQKFFTSPNGINWTSQSYTDALSHRDVAWIKELGKFIFCQDNSPAILSSKNIYQPYNLISLTNSSYDITYQGNPNNYVITTAVSIPSGSVDFQWEKSEDNGISFANVNGATSSVLSLTPTDRNTASDNGYIYRLKATSTDAKYPVSYIGKYTPISQPDNIYAVSNYSIGTISDYNWGDVVWSSKRGLFTAVAFGGFSETNPSRIAVSADGINWNNNTNTLIQYAYNGIAYSEELELFVAVANGVITTSSDGINWTPRVAPVFQNWIQPLYVSELGIFVILSRSTTGNAVLTSSNGITWTNSTTGVTQSMWGIAWSSSLNILVAVGDNGTIITSSNGTTWTSRTSPNTNAYKSVAWSPTLGMFVVISSTGTGNRVITSTDGITWTAGVSPANLSWRRIIWSDDLAMFIAVAENNVSNGMMYSTDGITWNLVTNLPATLKVGLVWSQDLKRLLATSWSGTGNRAIISADIFTNKNTVAAFTQVPRLKTKTYASNTSNITLVSNGSISNGNAAEYQWQISTDGGSNWSDLSGETNANLVLTDAEAENASTNSFLYRNQIKNTEADNTPLNTVATQIIVQNDNLYKVDNFIAFNPQVGRGWDGLAYSPQLNLLVAVAASGTGNRVMTSSDGITWTARASTDDTALWVSVVWSPALSLFVAVAQGGQIMTSPNGTAWTARTAPAAQQWRNVTWSAERGLFVAVAQGGTGNRIMTSPDGINWTLRTNTQSLQNVIWSANQMQFVAVGSNAVATSPDGITWTTRTAPANQVWRGLEYSPSLNLFVAVSENGANRVATSPDGITWTLRSGAPLNQWSEVAWSEELGYFVACAFSGTGNRLMHSSDGINWTATDSPNDGLVEIIWVSALGRFVVCSFSGLNQILFSSTIP